MSQSSDSVARKIIQQLGGNKFIAMTGAQYFLHTPVGLTFRLKKAALGGVNFFRITLVNDTYDLEALKFNSRTCAVELIQKRQMLMADQLPSAFTAVSGLATHL